eukprot:562241-Pelagomonas_calceolata.AAC.2
MVPAGSRLATRSIHSAHAVDLLDALSAHRGQPLAQRCSLICRPLGVLKLHVSLCSMSKLLH